MKSKIPVFHISNYKNHPDNKGEIYIKSFADHICEHDFIDTPHSHDFYLFVFCTKGHGKHHIDFKTYDFKPNRLFILNPGQIHHWTLSEDIEGSILFFKPSFYFTKFPQKTSKDVPVLRSMSSINYVDFSKEKGAQLFGVLKELSVHNTSNSTWKDEIFASYINILIHLVLDSVEEMESEISSLPQLNNHYLIKFEDVLECNFYKEHKVSFYANEIGVSPEHLNRLCKKHFQKSSKKMINERIVLEARRLLCQNENSIQMVADELHFSDLSNFVKFFKRETLTTPAKFRIDYR